MDGAVQTLEAAVKDKHRNWLLVYGGGTMAALAMDVELRQASGDKLGLPDLMKAMYAEFGVAGKTYTHADIVRVGKQISGADLGPTLEAIVGSDTPYDLTPVFGAIGLQLEQYGMLETFLLRKDSAPAQARARFSAIFGMPY